jgi:hypothetical protein
MILVISFFIAAFLAGAVTGIITIVIVGIRRDDREKTLTEAPRTHAEASARRLLAGVRNHDSDSEQE